MISSKQSGNTVNREIWMLKGFLKKSYFNKGTVIAESMKCICNNISSFWAKLWPTNAVSFLYVFNCIFCSYCIKWSPQIKVSVSSDSIIIVSAIYLLYQSSFYKSIASCCDICFNHQLAQTKHFFQFFFSQSHSSLKIPSLPIFLSANVKLQRFKLSINCDSFTCLRRFLQEMLALLL